MSIKDKVSDDKRPFDPFELLEEKNEDQMTLFDMPEWWEEHWQGMPEYIQPDMTPYKTLFVHFRNEKDYQDFAQLVEQRLLLNTKYIWHPSLEKDKLVHLRYADEKEK